MGVRVHGRLGDTAHWGAGTRRMGHSLLWREQREWSNAQHRLLNTVLVWCNTAHYMATFTSHKTQCPVTGHTLNFPRVQRVLRLVWDTMEFKYCTAYQHCIEKHYYCICNQIKANYKCLWSDISSHQTQQWALHQAWTLLKRIVHYSIEWMGPNQAQHSPLRLLTGCEGWLLVGHHCANSHSEEGFDRTTYKSTGTISLITTKLVGQALNLFPLT